MGRLKYQTMNSLMKAWADLPPLLADRVVALLTSPDRPARRLHRTNQLLLDADHHCDPHWLRPLRWAILYRHVVHDPRATPKANRRACAELWLEHFPAIHDTVRNVSGAWEAEVAMVLEADPLERPPGLRPWQHALLDLDLGALGAPAALYEADRLVRWAEAEEAGVRPEIWGDERCAWLGRVLACPRLYHLVLTERADAARANVRRELDAVHRGRRMDAGGRQAPAGAPPPRP